VARKVVFARNGLTTTAEHQVQVTVLSGRVDLDALLTIK